MNAELLRSLLDYDPTTGTFKFRCRADTSNAWNARWAGKEAGNLGEQLYVSIQLLGRSYKAHRLAWLYVYGEWPDGDLDHEDTDRSNNRIGNLRSATRSQNLANTFPRSNNTSGFKGVTWNKKNSKWVAAIRKGKSLHLGCFDEIEHAAAAYRIAAAYIFGEFAR